MNSSSFVFTPFSDQQTEISGVEIDSASDKIVFTGELVVTRSVEGLKSLERLMDVMRQTKEVLLNEQEEGVLAETYEIVAAVEKDNPFV